MSTLCVKNLPEYWKEKYSRFLKILRKYPWRRARAVLESPSLLLINLADKESKGRNDGSS